MFSASDFTTPISNVLENRERLASYGETRAWILKLCADFSEKDERASFLATIASTLPLFPCLF